MGPDFGKDKRADVVKLLREAIARGAELIQQQGDAGLDATTKYEWGNRMVRHSYIWTVGSLWCITGLMEWCRRIRGGRVGRAERQRALLQNIPARKRRASRESKVKR